MSKIKLTKRQEKELLKGLTAGEVKDLKTLVRSEFQAGSGIGDIAKLVASLFTATGRVRFGKDIKSIIKFIKVLLPRRGRPRGEGASHGGSSHKGGFLRKGGALKPAGAGALRPAGGRLGLTLAQQRALIKSLSPIKKTMIRRRIKKGAQSGEGIGDVIKAIAKVLRPLIAEVGPKVLSEIVVPLFKKFIEASPKRRAARRKRRKQRGSALSPAGGFLRKQRGSALKPAGAGALRPSGGARRTIRVKKKRLAF